MRIITGWWEMLVDWNRESNAGVLQVRPAQIQMTRVRRRRDRDLQRRE
jgi:hypothetical protein